MSYRASMPTFAGGEIAATITARYDTAKYGTALERGRNTLGLPGGGAYNRPGLQFAGECQDYTKRAVLIPFTFSVDQSYALEFAHLTMRVFSGGAPVTRPRLTITAISQTNPVVVTIPGSGYQVGWDVYFEGVEGMVQINGRIGRVLDVDGDDVTLDIDASAFSAFTADTGGVLGDAEGGDGGYPPVDPNPPPPDIPDDPLPPPIIPPRCVWDQAWIGDGLRAAQAVVGSPLLMLSTDAEITYAGAVQAISFDQRPGVRLKTTDGVVLTCSTTAPVPVRRGDEVVFLRAGDLKKGQEVRCWRNGELFWNALASVSFVGSIRVARISANDGVYFAGDMRGAGIFTHNIKMDYLYEETV